MSIQKIRLQVSNFIAKLQENKSHNNIAKTLYCNLLMI